MAETFIWADMDPELTKDTSGDVKRDTDVNAILNSLENIIGTEQGSRRMLQKFGGNIRGLLFEPMDDMTSRMIGQKVVDSINYWEDRININGLDIEPIYKMNVYRCRLRFTIKGSDTIQEIDFVLSR